MGKKILLVEDDKSNGETIKEILTKVGYSVTWIDKPYEALQFYLNETKSGKSKSSSNPFDLVLLDFSMPNLTGIDVAAGLMMINPQQRIVFHTAYPKSLIENSPDYEKGIEILEKPASLNQLIKVVNGSSIDNVEDLDKKQLTKKIVQV